MHAIETRLKGLFASSGLDRQGVFPLVGNNGRSVFSVFVQGAGGGRVSWPCSSTEGGEEDAEFWSCWCKNEEGDWMALEGVVFCWCDWFLHGLLAVQRLGMRASRTIQTKLPRGMPQLAATAGP